MRKIQHLLFLTVLVLMTSCTKKHTCSFNYYYNPPGVAFVGYDSSELSQVVIGQYTTNTEFQELISLDTLKAESLIFQGDTVYTKNGGSASDGFLTLELGKDYKIHSLTDNKEFRITEVSEPVKTETWTQDHDCSSGSATARITTYSLKIDGVHAQPAEREVNNWIFYIHR